MATYLNQCRPKKKLQLLPTLHRPDQTATGVHWLRQGESWWNSWEEMCSGGDCHAQKSNDREETIQLTWTEKRRGGVAVGDRCYPRKACDDRESQCSFIWGGPDAEVKPEPKRFLVRLRRNQNLLMMTSGQKKIERDRGAGDDRLNWKMRKLQQIEKEMLSSEIKRWSYGTEVCCCWLTVQRTGATLMFTSKRSRERDGDCGCQWQKGDEDEDQLKVGQGCGFG